MVLNNIDNYFKKVIQESENYYQKKAPKSKNNIWAEIVDDKKFKSRSMVKFLITSSIAVLLVLFLMQFQLNRQKDILISDLNNKIIELQDENNNYITALHNNKLKLNIEKRIDTVFIEAIKPVKEIETIVRYVTDTFYITPDMETKQFDQFANVQNDKIQNYEPVKPKEKSETYNVEFIGLDKGNAKEENKRLPIFINEFTKKNLSKKSKSKNLSLQANIKQFLLINSN